MALKIQKLFTYQIDRADYTEPKPTEAALYLGFLTFLKSQKLPTLWVREDSPGHYGLIRGCVPLRVAQISNVDIVDCLVFSISEGEAVLLNQSESTFADATNDPIGLAQAIVSLSKALNITYQELGAKIGMHTSVLSNKIRLLELPLEIQQKITTGRLPESMAKGIVNLSEAQQKSLVAKLEQQKLQGKAVSVRLFEKWVTEVHKGRKKIAFQKADKKSRAVTEISLGVDYQHFQRNLSESLGYPTKLTAYANGFFQLQIQCDSEEELEGLFDRVGWPYAAGKIIPPVPWQVERKEGRAMVTNQYSNKQTFLLGTEFLANLIADI